MFFWTREQLGFFELFVSESALASVEFCCRGCLSLSKYIGVAVLYIRSTYEKVSVKFLVHEDHDHAGVVNSNGEGSSTRNDFTFV